MSYSPASVALNTYSMEVKVTDMKMSEENEQAMVLDQLDSVTDTVETDAMPSTTKIEFCGDGGNTHIYHDSQR